MADLQLNGTTIFTETAGVVSYSSNVPQGMIVNVTVFRDFTRRTQSAGGGSTHTDWACGTFTKKLSTSMIIADFHMPGENDHSGVCGTGLRIDNDTSLWRYGVAYQYHDLWQPNSMQAICGSCFWARSVVSAGDHAMNFGWYPANGNTGERPFSQSVNPNSSSDGRNPQHGSTVAIFEVA